MRTLFVPTSACHRRVVARLMAGASASTPPTLWLELEITSVTCAPCIHRPSRATESLLARARRGRAHPAASSVAIRASTGVCHSHAATWAPAPTRRSSRSTALALNFTRSTLAPARLYCVRPWVDRAWHHPLDCPLRNVASWLRLLRLSSPRLCCRRHLHHRHLRHRLCCHRHLRLHCCRCRSTLAGVRTHGQSLSRF